jgi:hypothetical protein
MLQTAIKQVTLDFQYFDQMLIQSSMSSTSPIFFDLTILQLDGVRLRTGKLFSEYQTEPDAQ